MVIHFFLSQCVKTNKGLGGVKQRGNRFHLTDKGTGLGRGCSAQGEHKVEKHHLIHEPDFCLPLGNCLSTEGGGLGLEPQATGLTLVEARGGKRSFSNCSSEKDNEWGRQWLAGLVPGTLGGRGWGSSRNTGRDWTETVLRWTGRWTFGDRKEKASFNGWQCVEGRAMAHGK